MDQAQSDEVPARPSKGRTLLRQPPKSSKRTSSFLCGCDKSFPLHLWYRLLPQAEHTLNMLQPARMIPSVSAYAHLWGKHDYNSNPFCTTRMQSQSTHHSRSLRDLGTPHYQWLLLHQQCMVALQVPRSLHQQHKEDQNLPNSFLHAQVPNHAQTFERRSEKSHWSHQTSMGQSRILLDTRLKGQNWPQQLHLLITLDWPLA
jgi:hypothetical protein